MNQKLRIVIADDHTIVRVGLRGMLEAELGFEVVGEAGTTPEAIERVGATRPDILLLDLTMPGCGGISALNQIRKISPETRVVILTMHDDAEYVRVAIVSGASGFILKHADSNQLVEAIRAVRQGRTYIDPTLAGAALRETLLPTRHPNPERAQRTPVERLSPRERTVLRHLALGFTNQEVADRLAISVKSVETYRARLAQKLGFRRRAELVRCAIENQLVDVRDAPFIG